MICHVTIAWNIKMSIWTPIGHQGLAPSLEIDGWNEHRKWCNSLTGDTQVYGFLRFPKDLGFLKETNWVFETCMCPGFSIYTYIIIHHLDQARIPFATMSSFNIGVFFFWVCHPKKTEKDRSRPFNLCWVPASPYEAFNACSETQKYFSISSKAQVQETQECRFFLWHQVRKWNDIMYMSNEKNSSRYLATRTRCITVPIVTKFWYNHLVIPNEWTYNDS